MFEDTSTPAVVLVCHRQAGIGIVRSLGRAGVPVYAIDSDRFSPALSSRYCRGKFIWDLHTEPAEESLRFLTEVARQIGRRALLIPTSDIGAMFVAEHASRLLNRFIFPQRDTALVRSLCSKKEMYYLAEKLGLPAPKTAFPTCRDDVVKYLETARFPILLKPIYTRSPKSQARQWQMMLVHNARELLENYDSVEDPALPNAMLQEYIPGADEMTWTFNGYFDRQGECRVAFTGRKLRNFRPYFGQASLGICMKNEHVEKTTVRFMQAIGYKGPLDLGYRYDARDGLYKVNDVNPRIGAMFRLFVDRNGMDVARALYQDMTGQPVTPASTPEGRKWMVEDGDLFSSFRY
jgi:predicted ATP-grasp superfamily ATP-dependent carboligase